MITVNRDDVVRKVRQLTVELLHLIEREHLVNADGMVGQQRHSVGDRLVLTAMPFPIAREMIRCFSSPLIERVSSRLCTRDTVDVDLFKALAMSFCFTAIPL